MTVSAYEAESTALNRLEPLLAAKGYRMIRSPGDRDLPPFLAGRRPDAIAVGRKPSLLIEVFGKDSPAALEKVRDLRSLLKGREDWDLNVYYFSSMEPAVEPVSDAAALDAAAAARSVVETEPRAALLFAWSILEAAARAGMDAAKHRPLNPHVLVNLLVAEGCVDQDAGSELFRLAKVRSQVAHGQIDIAPKAEDVRFLLAVAEDLSGNLQTAE
jgi:hypothetical protein